MFREGDKLLPVRLAVVGQGKMILHQDALRDHVGRQVRTTMGEQFGGVTGHVDKCNEANGPALVTVSAVTGKTKTSVETFALWDTIAGPTGGITEVTSLSPFFLTGAAFTGLTPATVTDFTVSATTIDTNLDVLCTGGVVLQATGPAICVIRARTITIGPGNVAVTGPRALALVSDQALRVTGTLDASATISPCSSRPG